VEIFCGHPLLPHTEDALERLSAMTRAIGPISDNLAIKSYASIPKLFTDTNPPLLKLVDSSVMTGIISINNIFEQVTGAVSLAVRTYRVAVLLY
jgi:hypothetical protein